MDGPVLITDFKEAARSLKRDMAVYRAALDSTALTRIPAYDPGYWNPDREHTNCYNFALHYPTWECAIPGDFSDFTPLDDEQGDIERRAQEIHEHILGDGLIYLGDTFEDAARYGVPVALFLKDKNSCKDKEDDFHFFAIRNLKDQNTADVKPDNLVWAGKRGANSIYKIGAWQNFLGRDIFSVAAKDEYNFFAGYYAAPQREALHVTSPRILAANEAHRAAQLQLA